MAKQISLIEDEPAIRENYAEALRKQGYDVAGYAGRDEAMASFRRRLPDLAIIDIALGDDSEAGFELCRELRGLSSSLPIIFLTARDADIDIISGLRLGADDYLTKDVSIHQILARVAALFRRIEAFQNEQDRGKLIRVSDLSIDTDRMSVDWKGNNIILTVTEFWILNSLVRHPGHVKSREQLMSDAGIFVDDGTVTSHVKRIRRKFETIDPEFEYIDTVYGMGYRWKS
ncbi:MAG: proteobacterial dedicated sortase system response regulator [Gammaproteobacteria bacterium]